MSTACRRICGGVACLAAVAATVVGGVSSPPPGGAAKYLFVDRELFANVSSGVELTRHRPHRAVRANGGRVLWPDDPPPPHSFQGFGAYSGLMAAGDGTYRAADGTIRMYYQCGALDPTLAVAASSMCLVRPQPHFPRRLPFTI